MDGPKLLIKLRGELVRGACGHVRGLDVNDAVCLRGVRTTPPTCVALQVVVKRLKRDTDAALVRVT